MILFDNATARVIADLLAGLAGAAPVSGAHVDGVTPQIVVTSDGVTSRVRGVVQRVTVRVVAWHHTDIEASALAQLALAVLDEAGHVPLTGPVDAIDPATRRPISAVTVRVNMQGRLA
jgi:hypothetical protein